MIVSAYISTACSLEVLLTIVMRLETPRMSPFHARWRLTAVVTVSMPPKGPPSCALKVASLWIQEEAWSTVADSVSTEVLAPSVRRYLRPEFPALRMREFAHQRWENSSLRTAPFLPSRPTTASGPPTSRTGSWLLMWHVPRIVTTSSRNRKNSPRTSVLGSWIRIATLVARPNVRYAKLQVARIVIMVALVARSLSPQPTKTGWRNRVYSISLRVLSENLLPSLNNLVYYIAFFYIIDELI